MKLRYFKHQYVCMSLVRFNDSNFTLLPPYSHSRPTSLSLSLCFSPRTTMANDQSLRGNHWICNLRKSSDIALYYKRAGPRLPPSTKLPVPPPPRRREDFACEYFQIREYAKSRGTRDPPVIFVGSKCLQLYSRILLSRLKINWISTDKSTDLRDTLPCLSWINNNRIIHSHDLLRTCRYNEFPQAWMNNYHW